MQSPRIEEYEVELASTFFGRNGKLSKQEKLRRRALRERTLKDWHIALRTVDNYHVRCRLACYIWWDYLAPRRETSQTFECYIKHVTIESPKVSSDCLRRALYSIGYTAILAYERVPDQLYYQNHGRKTARLLKEYKHKQQVL